MFTHGWEALSATSHHLIQQASLRRSGSSSSTGSLKQPLKGKTHRRANLLFNLSAILRPLCYYKSPFMNRARFGDQTLSVSSFLFLNVTEMYRHGNTFSNLSMGKCSDITAQAEMLPHVKLKKAISRRSSASLPTELKWRHF